jgi:hypothetical protein
MLQYLIKLWLFATLLFAYELSIAQGVPESISYQAIVRDANGNELVNQFVTIEFAIRKDAVDGPIYFEEFHDLVPTNQFGLFTTNIGGGVNTGSGLFNSLGELPWNTGIYFMEVRASLPGSGTVVILGTSQFMAMPYSFYANESALALSADTVMHEADGDPTNELIQNFSITGTTLTIEENNIQHSVNIGDVSAYNEIITNVTLQNDTSLIITEGDITTNYNLSDLAYVTWNKTNNTTYNNSATVGINTATPTSTFEVNGSLSLKLLKVNIPGSYIIGGNLNQDVAVYLCDVTAGAVTITLPSAASCAGRVYKFKKRDSASVGNNLTVLSTNNEIEGEDDFTLGANFLMEFATLISDGIGWNIIDYSFYTGP